MGQRAATETLYGIIAAFIERRTWTQVELARRLEIRPEAVRRRLVELQASGFKLERQEDHPHVYWSVPKNWFPGALAFKPDEVPDLVRLISRAPKSALRERILAAAVNRLANVGHAKDVGAFEPKAIHTLEVNTEEERWLTLIEDAAAKKIAVKMRYFTASRRSESWRHVSVHRVDLGVHPHFIATCHRSQSLRRFRIRNVSDARLDQSEPFRPVTAEELAAFERQSFDGFHEQKNPPTKCSFVVREADAAWVSRSLPEGGSVSEEDLGSDGVRFSIETTAVSALARFVVGLGAAARPETKLLADEVASIARAALANATSSAP